MRKLSGFSATLFSAPLFSALALPLLALSACAPSQQAVHPQSLAATAPAATAQEVRAPVTLLVSIDGFRPDYLHKGNSPNLDALAAGGIFSAMRPSFPSKTFPNHYAIVTGLRPDRNGMVGNSMYDIRKPGVKFTLSDAKQATDRFWWDEGEPLWVTAENQGIRTATMFWPGSQSDIHGVRPSDWQAYDMNVNGAQRVRAIIDWLRRPADIRPKFLTLYFDDVDTAGHKYGPAAPETAKAVTEVDSHIGELVEGLKALGQPVNLIVLSDHGMAATARKRMIDMDKILPRDSYHYVTGGTYAGLDPAPGKEAAVDKALLGPHDHMQCWHKENLPERFHYGHNPRVPAILCLAQVGWEITQGPGEGKNGGDHGYDNWSPDMAALFIASGPAFAKGATPRQPFDNVDVYPLLARLTGVTPLSGDGDPTALAGLLAR